MALAINMPLADGIRKGLKNAREEKLPHREEGL